MLIKFFLTVVILTVLIVGGYFAYNKIFSLKLNATDSMPTAEDPFAVNKIEPDVELLNSYSIDDDNHKPSAGDRARYEKR